MTHFERAANSPSRTGLTWLLAFVAGTAAHAFGETPWRPVAVWLAGLVPLVAILVAVWRRPRWRFGVGAVLGCLLALARYDVALARLPQPGAIPERLATFRGIVRDEPERGINGTVLTLDRVFVAAAATGAGEPVSGAVSLGFAMPLEFRYGDWVEWSCRLRPAPPDWRFREAALWTCLSREAPRLVSRGVTSWSARLFDLKARLRRLVIRLLPEPEASFLLGLLIGERQGLPDRLAAAFRASGTSHILAVSGYNVTKVVEIALILFACGRIRRRRAAALALLVVLAFAAMTGGEASVVRAAVMGSLVLLASILGRRYSGAVALAAAAASMLAVDPFLLRHDIGFRLSYAAVCGLHFLGPPLAKRLTCLPVILEIRKNAADTLAATLATLPFVLQAFGRLPLIGPVANLLILPLVPWAMLTGALAVAVGSVHPSLGLPFAWPAYWLLRLIETLASGCAALAPWAVEVQVGPWACLSLTGFLTLLWFALARAKPVSLVRRRPLPPQIEVEVSEL